MSPLELPPSSAYDSKAQRVVDLMVRVEKIGRFPEAHSGFADVWKGVWKDVHGHERTVAVKVLRSCIGDPKMDDTVQKRLARELAGTVSGFGTYVSMVWPWLDNGSVTRYMERCGDILSMPDRLQILVEVAGRLAYLHSHDIVHGDLSGASILIGNERRACLCDFGLSSFIANFESTTMYSTISGAVRWADAFLYKMQMEEDQVPKPTPCSDIYSFGSVTLEVAYHTTTSVLTLSLWRDCVQCWIYWLLRIIPPVTKREDADVGDSSDGDGDGDRDRDRDEGDGAAGESERDEGNEEC
ncbi:hypothetical protein D9758_015109 [Tetrapyrgos nigripes]|uniref:Protein kinase domain-containing protein n=1 Tax=Tetrapyrgos nigripes TaxID=182062 RepID=A0A8H5C001_9AGAR|nr:hypothetical protein D9758_015109 [Tetrapyrgos nigripes]